MEENKTFKCILFLKFIINHDIDRDRERDIDRYQFWLHDIDYTV